MRGRLARWMLEIALVAAVVVGVHTYRTRDLPEGPFPRLELTTVQGRTLEVGTSTRRPLLLHVWASWCGVCKAMHSQVDELVAEYDVVSIASRSGSPAEVQAFLNAEGWSAAPTVVDADGSLARRLGVNAFPTSIVLAPDGTVRFSEVGYTTGWGLRARLWWAGL